jgi:DNA processing protein
MAASVLPWLDLKSVPGIGNLRFKRLVDRFGGPEAALSASEGELLRVEGISRRLAGAIRTHRTPAGIERELDRAEALGFRILAQTDPAYPPLLLQTPDPPPVLYTYGDLAGVSRAVAVVGSRQASRYGLQTTRRLAGDLAEAGVTVVSGMARGIDTAAHEGALKRDGRTVAVLGSGLDRIYPSENRDLYHRIAESGAVISEFPLGSAPEPHRFPIRNRIISGVCLGTVVVEATEKSGSLITARLALEQDREVFAVPGNIHSFKSAGTHRLIKQGALLVESARDVLELLSQAIRGRIADPRVDRERMLDNLPAMTPDEAKVFHALGPDPVHIDDLVRKVAMAPAQLSGILLQLELKGVVHQAPGKRFAIEIDNLV